MLRDTPSHVYNIGCHNQSGALLDSRTFRSQIMVISAQISEAERDSRHSRALTARRGAIS